MARVILYNLEPTARIPNSPLPLLYYPKFFEPASMSTGEVYEVFKRNGWITQWAYRYGSSQRSHYHSEAHECMAVLHGQAIIRFGVADTSPDLDENTHGVAFEAGGVEVAVSQGDVFVIPAGISHKTYNTRPVADLALLTPGDGHDLTSDDPHEAVAKIKLEGFVMLGAYPAGAKWDFATGDEETAQSWNSIWSIPLPDRDPVLAPVPQVYADYGEAQQ